MPRGGKRAGAGRPEGTQNMIHRERSVLAQYERAAQATGRERRKLCKEIMAEHANYFHDLAAMYQPLNPDGTERREGDWTKFVQFSVLAVEAASKGAPYESPRYAAIAIASTPPGSRESQMEAMSPRERMLTMLRDIEKRLRGGQVIEHDPNEGANHEPTKAGQPA